MDNFKLALMLLKYTHWHWLIFPVELQKLFAIYHDEASISLTCLCAPVPWDSRSMGLVPAYTSSLWAAELPLILPWCALKCWICLLTPLLEMSSPQAYTSITEYSFVCVLKAYCVFTQYVKSPQARMENIWAMSPKFHVALLRAAYISLISVFLRWWNMTGRAQEYGWENWILILGLLGIHCVTLKSFLVFGFYFLILSENEWWEVLRAFICWMLTVPDSMLHVFPAFFLLIFTETLFED